MRYYLNTSTESYDEETKTYNEYGKKETKGTGEDAKTNAIAELHTLYATMLKSKNLVYWCGKVEDTKEHVIDKLECGEYVEPTAVQKTSYTYEEIDNMKSAELKETCKNSGITGYSSMTVAEMKEALWNHYGLTA